MARGDLPGGRPIHVEHPCERGARMRRDVGRMHAADAPAAKDGNSEHLILPETFWQ
jgi:hypothetical protein